MKRSSAFFLQTATVLFGLAVLGFLLWEPHVEGRNAHATLFEIYFKDAFLACAYIASIPFFVALYQVFRLFGDAGRSELFSLRSLSALRTIRTCAIMLLGSIAVAEAFLFIMVRGQDDIAGGVAMGILFALVFAAMAAAAVLFERRLQARILT